MFEFVRITLTNTIMVKASYSKLTDVAHAYPEEIQRYTDLLLRDLNEVKNNLNALLSGGK